MKKDVAVIHHADRRRDVMMPYAPALLVRRGGLLFLSGVTAAPVYHSHPHRDEEFDLPRTMHDQAVLTMENVKKTLEAAGAGMSDIVWATRYLTNIAEQDDMNRVWAQYLGGHLPATTTVEVARLATHANCKLEISVIAVADADAGERRRHGPPSRGAKARVKSARPERRAAGVRRRR
jgi:enamine deaminase RidA (YjgF/YER057c/UK114 family)